MLIVNITHVNARQSYIYFNENVFIYVN